MFRYNLLFGIRSLIQNKTYSILNILGFTIGLTCVMLLYLQVNYDLHYDNFHKHYQQIYSLSYWQGNPRERNYTRENVSASLGPSFLQTYPEIKSFARTSEVEVIFNVHDKTLKESGLFVDTSFFEIFSFPLLNSPSSQTFSSPDDILITATLAHQLFGNTPCIGRSLHLKYDNENHLFTIRGILKDVPAQSSLQFKFLLPMEKRLNSEPYLLDIHSYGLKTWFLLKPGIPADHLAISMQQNTQLKISGSDRHYFLHPFRDVHLYNYVNGKLSLIGPILDVIIFSAIGIILLLIASFNFMNLGIALSSKRHWEAGVKKIMGSSPVSIFFQFLVESVLLTLIGFILALGILPWLIPVFNANSSPLRSLVIPWSSPVFYLLFLSVTFLTGILSGLYPGILLSSVRSIHILHKKPKLRTRISWIRQGLIVFQFVISFIFISCSLIIWVQADYLDHKELGIQKDHILYFPFHEGIQQHREAFRARLEQNRQIESVTFTNFEPFNAVYNGEKVEWPGHNPDQENYFSVLYTDFNFHTTYHPRLMAGRYFDPDQPTDSSNFLINQTAAQRMGLKNPIDKPIQVGDQNGTIIGMVADFHTNSLMSPYEPLIISIHPDKSCFVTLRMNSSNPMALIAEQYKVFEPDYPFEPKMANDNFKANNIKEKTAPITAIFGGIAIFLACLGLIGLVSFSAEQKTKEIGIRKINGAMSGEILHMLLRSYILWVVIAIIAGIPIASLLGRAYLSMYVFRTSFPWWSLITGAIVVLSIALLTVSLQSWRAANKNPVDSLRYE